MNSYPHFNGRLLIHFICFCFLLQISNGCDNVTGKQKTALKAYWDLIQIGLNESIDISKGCKVGYVNGDASMVFDKYYILVDYEALGYEASEIGDLTNMAVYEEARHVNTIRGTWDCRTSGDGQLVISLREQGIHIDIYGQDWHYWQVFQFDEDSPAYEKAVNILEVAAN